LAGLAQQGDTRLLLTSREAPPAPLDGVAIRLGPLSKREGRALIAGVLAQAGRAPAGDSTERRVDELIEKVGGHARSLVLLAPLVAERGLQVTAETVAQEMAELEAKNPGVREFSLLASVRLSLDRLPETAHRQVKAFAVFHGAVNYEVLAQVLEVQPDAALALCRQLVEFGLAGAQGPYLFPDPALGPAVAVEVTDEERCGMEERWIGASMRLIDFLYEMHFRDAQVAMEGTQAALQDLMAAMAQAEQKVGAQVFSVEMVMMSVTRLQTLGRTLGRPTVLAQLEELRQRLGRQLEDWSHAQFESARTEIEEKLATGNISGALASATSLDERAEASWTSYPEAYYDRALANLLLGRALRTASRASEALLYLERQRRDSLKR
ncbi:MAG TPA: hypothetical protein VFE33_20040, partial [Thermoanaerobaculia bacterium]|nr:hypothetical protein [Thermoanaerobaculia bacterium]